MGFLSLRNHKIFYDECISPVKNKRVTFQTSCFAWGGIIKNHDFQELSRKAVIL